MAELWILNHIKQETRDGKERTFFDRCGRAFLNKNGSFNIYIERLPTGLTGETVFNLDKHKPKEARESDTFEE